MASTQASSSSAPPPVLSAPPTAPPSISPTLPSSTSSQSHPSPPMASPSSHSPETRRQIAEARVALEASMSNIGSNLDRTLRSRAENLHANSKQLDKQQKDVIKATADLHKESTKLQKLADEGSKKIKELGNVQNWAEMLERDFLVLGETLRLANLPSDEEWETSEGESQSESDDEERMKRFVYGEHKFVPEESPAIESPAVDSPRVDSPMILDAEGDTKMAMESGDGKHLQDQKQKQCLENVIGQNQPPALDDSNIDENTKLDKGKGKAVDIEMITDGQYVSTEPTIQEHHAEEQHQESIGGSATATMSSNSDPSSTSIHTTATAES